MLQHAGLPFPGVDTPSYRMPPFGRHHNPRRTAPTSPGPPGS